MLAKKTPSRRTQAHSYHRELRNLYARRSAIDTLIQSLETYDRFRERTAARSSSGRKSA